MVFAMSAVVDAAEGNNNIEFSHINFPLDQPKERERKFASLAPPPQSPPPLRPLSYPSAGSPIAQSLQSPMYLQV